MAIRNPLKFMDGFWNWDFINDVLPGRRKVSDIDGITEYKGHFLVFETKGLGVPLPLAQQIMFESMQRTKKFTVVVVWGNRNQVDYMQVFYPNGNTTEKKAANNEILKSLAVWWSDQAEKNGGISK